MTPNIKASDTNWHVTSVSFDKQMAIPVDPTAGFPANAYYIKVSVQVTNDDGDPAPQNTPVFAHDNQNDNIISYWNADKTNYAGQVPNGFREFQTDSKGVANYYMAFNVTKWSDSPTIMAESPFMGRIVNVLVNMIADTSGAPSYSVLFCYYNNDNGTYAALDASQLNVPGWSESISKANYFISGLQSTVSQSQGASSNSPAVLILNETPVFGLDYGRILNSDFGQIAPYYELRDAQESSRILYFVQDGTSSPGRLSKYTTFDFSLGNSIPQAMPNPDVPPGDGFVPPYWYGAMDIPDHIPQQTLGPTALNATHDGSHNFEVIIEYPAHGTIEKGDIINVFAYLSGYTQDGVQQTQVYGDGSLVAAAPFAESSDNIFQFKAYEDDFSPSPNKLMHSIMIPGSWLQGFGQKSSKTPGYMWVNYKVTPADHARKGAKWSSPYTGFESALKINFAGFQD